MDKIISIGFFEPPFRGWGHHRCVALLYALFNNDLNDEVSDTTGDEERTKACKKNL
jgi:hypothetical protein